ncbi:hypothetical protein ES706_05748 [subsurface metagenome]
METKVIFANVPGNESSFTPVIIKPARSTMPVSLYIFFTTSMKSSVSFTDPKVPVATLVAFTSDGSK